ncbi:MAG: DUF2589 domain-containing protein [Succinivibrio sp.]
MSQKISLKVLISSLARSFADAQSHMSWTQLLSIRNFFNSDGTPKTLDVKLPGYEDQGTDNQSGSIADNADNSGQVNTEGNDPNSIPEISLETGNTLNEKASDDCVNPSENTSSGITFRDYSVPLLSVAPLKPLNLKEALIDFSVGISDIEVNSTLKNDPSFSFLNATERNKGKLSGDVPQDLIVDMKSLTTSKVGNIKVKLKIESSEVEDGYARLINALSQLQGDWKKHS